MIGTRFLADPALVAIIVLLLTTFLLIISFLVVRSFEHLAEANRMKSEFVSIVSHQLRSPITNLSWALDFLSSGRAGTFKGEEEEYLMILKENIDRMNDLVSDLLIVSRVETVNLPLNKDFFSLEEITKHVIEDSSPFAKASNVEIKLEVEKNLPKAFADSYQIEQVIENLIDNAIKYVEGKSEAKINLSQKKDKLYFEIKDSGVGIPSGDQKLIFQKFFRSSNSLRQQTQGSGLGLFIAKSIVERSGGKIGFKSQVGEGTTFWFTLPTK